MRLMGKQTPLQAQGALSYSSASFPLNAFLTFSKWQFQFSNSYKKCTCFSLCGDRMTTQQIFKGVVYPTSTRHLVLTHPDKWDYERIYVGLTKCLQLWALLMRGTLTSEKLQAVVVTVSENRH